MKSVVRYLMAAILAVSCVVAVSTSWVMATAIPLLAARTTALIMGGTFHPLTGPKDNPDFVTSYLDNAVIGHLDPAFVGPVTNAVAVFTPEEFFPLGRLTLDNSVAEGRANLHRCLAAGADCVFNDDGAVNPGVGPSSAPQLGDAMLVFGFSQSSIIASLAKQDLISDHVTGDPAVPFMLVANPMRPNGGVLMRGLGLPTIAILGISFIGASPTNSAEQLDGTYVYPTVDVARQYDGLGGDFPVRPLNLLALVNTLFGYQLLHSETIDVPFDEARYQGREGDTSYYLVETDIVPILQPLDLLMPEPILKAIDAPLRVIIEDAYDRDIGPGTPTRFSWWPTNDVLALAGKLIKSLPVAVDNLVEGFGGSRVLGTVAPGTFGVGGPELPDEAPGVLPVGVVQPRQDSTTSDRVSADHVDSDADLLTTPVDTGEGERTATTQATGAEEASIVSVTDTDGPDVDELDVDVLDVDVLDVDEVDVDELDADEVDVDELALPETDPGPAVSVPDTDAAAEDSDDSEAADDSDAEAA